MSVPTSDEANVQDCVEQVLRAFGRVHAVLGGGFDRATYRQALARELVRAEVHVREQCEVEVFYDRMPVGGHCVDLVVDQRLLVMVDTSRMLTADRVSQLERLLRAAYWPAGILLNFGVLAEHWRVAWDGRSAGELGGVATSAAGMTAATNPWLS